MVMYYQFLSCNLVSVSANKVKDTKNELVIIHIKYIYMDVTK